MTINVGDTTASQTVAVQEARVMGKVLLQDSSSVPTVGTSGLSVRVFAGTDTSGSPDFTFATTSDATVNAVSVNWVGFVPASASGYTFVFATGPATRRRQRSPATRSRRATRR